VIVWANCFDELNGREKRILGVEGHPTVKPASLLRYLVRLVTRPGQIVLDPFAGSGSLGVACAKEHRDYVLIEKERAYYELARKRLAGGKG
jgi:DNA modification methylase